MPTSKLEKFAALAALLLLFLLPRVGNAKSSETTQKDVYSEIRSTLGFVPFFLKEFPRDALPGAWEEFKTINMNSSTSLSPKLKELIGLAVASEIPCHRCIYFHNEAAGIEGAKPAELNMAVALAASARRWTSFFYGSQVVWDTFKSDIDRSVENVKKSKEQNANNVSNKSQDLGITTRANALNDIQNSFGFVPTYLNNYPATDLAGSWNELKTLEMNPNGTLSPKEKFLIGLAVASSIPCTYCSYEDTAFARMYGATEREIQEAIIISGMERHWSVFMSGLQQEQGVFEEEASRILRHMRNEKNKKMASLNKI